MNWSALLPSAIQPGLLASEHAQPLWLRLSRVQELQTVLAAPDGPHCRGGHLMGLTAEMGTQWASLQRWAPDGPHCRGVQDQRAPCLSRGLAGSFTASLSGVALIL